MRPYDYTIHKSARVKFILGMFILGSGDHAWPQSAVRKNASATLISAVRHCRPTAGSIAARYAASQRSNQGRASVQQAGLAETVGNPLGILLFLERQTAHMFVERIFRVDLFELVPNAAGLVHLAKMTEN